MQRLVRLLLVSLFGFTFLPTHAQLVKRYSFIHYSPSNGLASNVVTNAFQDDVGYIWIGTDNGLQRFDGVRYKTFRSIKDDSTSIPNNYIVQILFDKKKTLWLVTSDGKIGTFDTHNFTYHPVKVVVRDSAWLKTGVKIICDDDGNLMLLFTFRGIATWSETQKEFSPEHNFIPIPSNWQIIELINQPGTKKYFIGTQGSAAIYNRQTKLMSYWQHNAEKDSFIEKLGTVPQQRNYMVDSKGRLWFFSWYLGMPKIFAYDLKRNEVVVNGYDMGPLIQNYFEIGGFYEQKNGTIWVRGLAVFGRYLEKEKQFQLVYNGYENEQSISFSRVDNFSEDREENMWICTNTNGLYRFNPSSQFFTNIRQINRLMNKPGDGNTMSFIHTRRGTMLVGTWGDGLYEYDSNYKMIPLNYAGIDQSTFAWCLSYSRDSNTIWVGAQPGIFGINPATRTAVYHNPPIMNDKTVRQIVQDKLGNLWMGMQYTGVFKWTAKNGAKNFDDGVAQVTDIPSTLIDKLMVDRNGYVWIGTSGQGIYVMDPAKDKVLFHLGSTEPEERKLLWDGIASILQYDDSTIMIAAASVIQIFNINEKKLVRTIKMPEDIPGWIASLEKDKTGYLWISTTNGIYRLNPKNNIFVHFDRADGIVNDRFVLAASYTTAEGKIAFGAENQFVIFNPEHVQINDPAPTLVISGFKLMNQPLLVDSLKNLKRVDLPPKNNSIAIEFSGLNYNGTFTTEYKLEGLDKDWIKSDQLNQAIYSYLPPGHYTFLAKTRDAEGHPSDHILRLEITVKPPFWRTWWFLGLAVFVVVGLLFWLDRLRTQKIRATESIRTRIATSLTEDMTNSLSSINISSELAKTKVDADKERTKEYISQISETSNRMIQAMYDMVWSIDPKNDTMLDTIERMKSFATEAEHLFDIDIIFDIDAAAADLDLDMANRYEMLSIFKEAIANVSKHSSARHVQVSLRLKNSRFFMLIEDDGKGFDVNKASLGRGINDMRRRAAGYKSLSLHRIGKKYGLDRETRNACLSRQSAVWNRESELNWNRLRPCVRFLLCFPLSVRKT